MGQRGYITVFLTLLISALLILVTTLIAVVDLSSARGRSATALRSSMSSVRAEYNRYLFEQYHMLFLNLNPEGEGSGKLEALVEERLAENLGEDYTVGEVQLTGVTGVMDEGCYEFRKQMKDASLYLVADKGVDLLKEKVGNDTPVTQEELDDLDMERDEGKEHEGDKDPRKSIRAAQLAGIAYRILPEDVTFSDEVIDPKKLPSEGKKGISLLAMNSGFNDLSRLKQEVSKTGGWMDSASQEAAGLVYAANCFNCLTDEVQEDTVLTLETEYLIAGKPTDAENYKAVIDQILVIRTACNFAYILTDADKMARMSALATSVTWYFPPAQPAVKYLLAGAWSYIEAVADAYRLVRGKKVPYLKSGENWITDLDGLYRLEELEDPEEDESGLDYEDYLLILLATRMTTAYYRMLDIMQLNVNRNVGEDGVCFELKDAITAFGMTVDVEYEGHTIRLTEEIGY